ncbi:MAG TPA: hypothetical protein VJU81_06985 [Methylomirabilota bacterium]|nr:hypothetical protein [Methylomirabilota bacterium]
METSDELLEKGRKAVEEATLPLRRPDRIWGGPGEGAECSICRTAVKREELEFDVEFHANGDGRGPERHHVHLRCFAVWDTERQRDAPA